MDAAASRSRALAARLRRPDAAMARATAIHAALGLFFVLFTTDLDRDLVRRGLLPAPGVAAYLAGAIAILAAALRPRSREGAARALAAVRAQASAVVRNHPAFFAAFAALAAMSLPYWFRREDPTPGALVFLAVAFGACAVAALLPLSERVRSGWRGYLAAAFLVYCAGIWIDVLRPGTFSVVDERAAGFATDTNTAAYAVSLLAAVLLRYRRIDLADLGVLYVSGLTVFLTLSRGGALVWLTLAGAYAAFVLVRSAGERRPAAVRLAAGAALTAGSVWLTMQTFDYFSQPATQERVHIFFGNQSWFRLRMKPTHRTVPLIAERYGGFADALETDVPIESAPAPGLLASVADGDAAGAEAPPPLEASPASGDAGAPSPGSEDATASTEPSPPPQPAAAPSPAAETPQPSPEATPASPPLVAAAPVAPPTPDTPPAATAEPPVATAELPAATAEPAAADSAADAPPPSADAATPVAPAAPIAPAEAPEATAAPPPPAPASESAAAATAVAAAPADEGAADGAEPEALDSRYVRQSGEYLYIDTVRVVRLKIAVEAIRDSPIVGYGNRYGSGEGLGAHNMYLAAWVDFGIAGFFAYAALMAGGLWGCWRLRFWPGLFMMGVLASWGMFSHTVLEQRSLFVVVGLMLALALAARQPAPGAGAERREALP